MNQLPEVVERDQQTDPRGATAENRLGADEKLLLAGLALLVIIIAVWLLSL